jgi:hypothetical protein
MVEEKVDAKNNSKAELDVKSKLEFLASLVVEFFCEDHCCDEKLNEIEDEGLSIHSSELHNIGVVQLLSNKLVNSSSVEFGPSTHPLISWEKSFPVENLYLIIDFHPTGPYIDFVSHESDLHFAVSFSLDLLIQLVHDLLISHFSYIN